MTIYGKTINGHPDYSITEDGKVYSHKFGKVKELKWSMSDKGYPRVGLGKKQYYIHALVCDTYLGALPEGMVRRHLDGNPLNNHISNLAIGTYKENGEDKVKHGRSITGIKHPCAKLTPFDVEQIKDLLVFGITHTTLGRMFGVSISRISDIRNNKSWQSNPAIGE